MKSIKLTAAALLIAATAGSAFAQGPKGNPADYGSPVAAGATARKVDLQSGAHYVNVTNGETVEFTNGSDSVIWHFDTFPGQNEVDLQAIAPQLNAQGVRVYVQDNPLYQG
ncbi:MAG TPA: CzcE family metal-binding protein [Pseudoduganella sp.]